MRSASVRTGAVVVVLAAAPALLGFDCGSAVLGAGVDVPSPVTWAAPNDVQVAVATDPFTMTFRDAKGNVLLESAPADPAAPDGDPLRAYAPLAITHDTDASGATVMYGWSNFRGVDDPWKRSARVVAIENGADVLTVHVATDDPAHARVTITVQGDAQGDRRGVRVKASVDGAGPIDPADATSVNRLSLGFVLHDDDHFMGLGERFVYGDQRGHSLYTWVEDGAFGQGEATPIGPGNPSPNGPEQTNIPIPWLMDPRGFGMLLNTTWRATYHFGEERADAWRVESSSGAIDFTLFADPAPTNLVESLTAITGRPPPIADWLLAPRRRGNLGSDEVAKLRAAHIPTSVIDTAVHYFPNGGGLDHAQMKAATADLHARGMKAVTYFCPFVADSWHPVFDDAAAKGYLVKKSDGTPYTVLDPPYNAAMVDFTNPDAVAWYQGFLQSAVDDGWDGWMYDFAEYVPPDAVFANGKLGVEMHNEYPVLYQQAALDFFERVRPGDFLFFVRSGYAGTGGRAPMVWAGDQSTDFDLGDGLPAALSGALNAGMSGLPLWGSDISGYHFLYNPPPDEELYLRWTELGAFSADMHDENEGSGNGSAADRWQIWKSQRSQDVYRKYALTKTRMLPYLRVAVRAAREHGTPVMRHLYLSYPGDARTYALQDEYLFGDSLVVAPVVTRGATSRTVYLPEPAYWDYWSGARVAGGGDVTVAAPLEVVPVLARAGALVPMLSADVETVVPSSDGSVVSMQDRAGFLEVQVFPGGDTSILLDDGTIFAQSGVASPMDAFDPTAGVAHTAGAIAPAASAADLMTCDACWMDDPAAHVLSIAVKAASDSVSAGPLRLSVHGSTSVKRYLFTVRH